MWSSFKRMSVTVAVASTAAFAVSPSAAAAETFPADVACSFELEEDVAGGEIRVDRTFVDANGNPVRMLLVGVGIQDTFTNADTGATITFPLNGLVIKTVINADGSQTLTLSGHNVLIMYPTDVPAGPSTTLYVGRVVINVDVNGVFTLVSTSGTATDICAALS